ncbi:MAG: porin [Proteobacteria bacterium]|nr:porin [Pseudomonadota bacterium]
MKKYLAIAIAGLAISPLAMSEVTVYGSLRTAIEYDSVSGATTAANNVNKVRLVDQSSRLGFRGADKLDNGLTVYWQSEHRPRVGASANDGTSTPVFGDRNTFVAIGGDFGRLQAGRYDDLIDQSMGDFYRGVNNIEETSGGVVNFVRRGATKPTNLLQYNSPKFSGFGFKAQYDFGSKIDDPNTTTVTDITFARGYGGSAFYNDAWFDVGVAYKQVDNNSSSKAEASTVAKDAHYKTLIIGANAKPLEGLNISAAWNHVDRKDASGNVGKQDSWGLGTTYLVGKYQYAVGYGQLQDGKYNGSKVADSKTWGVSLGLNYSLSKQTMLTSGVNYTRNGKTAGSKLTSSITTGTGLSAGAGATVKAVSVGMRTDF